MSSVMHSLCRTLALAGALSFLACSPGPSASDRTGVTVESLTPGGNGALSGLRAGDVLLSWHRRAEPPAGEAGGALRSCADLSIVEIQEAPRGPVTMQVDRQGRRFSVEMAPDLWQMEVVPRRPGADEGCEAFARARRLRRLSRRPEARAAFAQAAAAARARGRDLFAVVALHGQGFAALDEQDFQGAEAAFKQALDLSRKAAPGSLHEALAWHALGRMEQIRGAIAPSEAALRNALRIRQHLAPRSLEIASTLNILGIDAWRRGDLDGAQRIYLRCLGVTRERDPGGFDEGQVLNNLGLLQRASGDAAAAERSFTQAAQILQRTDTEGSDLARAVFNSSALASDRGDLAASEQQLRTALLRFEKIAPEGLDVADILNNLGSVARERYQLAEADALFRRSLAIQHHLAPGSEMEATGWSNLCWTALARERLDEAEEFGRRALDIRSRQSPGGPSVAISQSMLGAIALKRGDLKKAAELGERALAVQHRIAPGSLYEGEYLQFLGEVALRRKELQRAEALIRQALAVFRRLAPRSYLEGETLDLLGQALEGQGRGREAEAAYEQAAAAVEAQIGRIGGSDEEQSSFEAGYGRVYTHLIAIQVARGDAAAALHTLERSRARSLLALLAQRNLAAGDAPTALLDQQRRLDKEYETAQNSLAGLDSRHTAELEGLTATLARLRGERATLAARIAQASPHYASLRSPQPLDLPGIRAVLDPGTVLLSYCVSEDRTFLFVVFPAGTAGPGIEVHKLPIGSDDLAVEVSAFRGLILRGLEHPEVEPALTLAGRRLFDLLLAPAAPAVAGARRLLLSPDGPLHILPVAALIRPGGSFLAEDKPLHSVLSATLYAEIRRGRRAVPAGGPSAGSQGAEGPLVAFADPLIVATPATAATSAASGARASRRHDDPAEPPVRRYRNGLAPLPGAREEVRALAALWGKDAHVYIGTEASKKRFHNLPVRPRYLHFACHALLDRRFPLDSALALATPARADPEDNGLLQAWEIFEQPRLDAELVTLSACETGLGHDAGGEGLIGLTRAFQYAGARSVLASLWSVNDKTTALLMERFYTLLRAGRPKDLALQEAQRSLLHGDRDVAHPVHWAAFTLSGDWM
jgi:CHAT domain-containing protein/tetratricopeptide (TPR) repeat protein